MKTLLSVLLFLIAYPAPCARAEGDSFDHSHAALSAVLERHVEGDRVDYAALAKAPAALDAYLTSLGQVTPEELAGWERDQAYAFWINVYNATTLQVVRDAYPLASIRDIKRDEKEVWDLALVPLPAFAQDGKRLTLNQVEHEILRPRYEDPRVHAAVNCASEGCPPLLAQAFRAEDLDAQLDAQVRVWLADTTRNQFQRGAKTARVSKIFEWFAADFESAGGPKRWIARYAPEGVAAWITGDDVKLEFLEYSWKLNQVRAQ